MTPLTCIIVDDEPLALDILEDYIQKTGLLKLAARCSNAFDALKILQSQQIDLIFLDIEMPELSGIEFIKSLTFKPGIIFTTAYAGFALKGYDLDVIDYLLKPIPFDRFIKAVNKASDIIGNKKTNSPHFPGIQSDNKNKIENFILVKADFSLLKIVLRDILYIEGVKDYVKIRTANRSVLTLGTMKDLEEKLPSDMFMRIHKSFIINLINIEQIQRHRIIFGEKRIPVSENYRDNFYKRLKDFQI